MKRGIIFILLLLWIGKVVASQDKKTFQEKVNNAIAKGIKFLKRTQDRDGTWKYSASLDYRYGLTALATYTLMKCGVSPGNNTVRKGLYFLLKADYRKLTRGVYCVSLALMALSSAKLMFQRERRTGVGKIKRKLRELTRWLVDAQLPCGGWGYRKKIRFDNSNTQFAILGLRAAKNAGISVPQKVWQRTLRLLKKGQNKDGGWGYIWSAPSSRTKIYPAPIKNISPPSSASMTAGGISSFYICKSTLAGDKKIDIKNSKFLRSAFKCLERFCGRQMRLRSLYWLYSLERACMLSGVKKLGVLDWYREGAEILHKLQDDSGGWHGGWHDGGKIGATCFALLFLKKAFVGIGIETPSSRGKRGIETK
jgi:hypothetical protein